MKAKIYFILILLNIICYSSFSQVAPNSFKGYTLGQALSEFKLKNPKVKPQGPNYFENGIYKNGTKVYTIHTSTASGDDITVNYYFYNDKLVIIDVYYNDFVSSDEILKSLQKKYGPYTKKESKKIFWPGSVVEGIKDREDPITLYKWNQFSKSGLVFQIYLNHASMIFYDKSYQNQMKMKKIAADEKKSIGRIE